MTQLGVPLHGLLPISTRTTLCGGVTLASMVVGFSGSFQPTLPLYGERLLIVSQPSSSQPFQSTLPIRGATQNVAYMTRIVLFQPTLPAWGVTQTGFDPATPGLISTHAPPYGERPVSLVGTAMLPLFQPALPSMGSDLRPGRTWASTMYFNPRSSCGERPPCQPQSQLWCSFQLTLHLCGSDYSRCTWHSWPPNFNPHSLVGSDSCGCCCAARSGNFNPHSLVGSDLVQGDHGIFAAISIHTPL